MNIFKGLERIPDIADGTNIAIGNFDGVHLGHQKILSVLEEKSVSSGSASWILTFFPHPRNIINGSKTPMIQTLDQRLAALSRYDIENAAVINFDHDFSQLSAEGFISDILLGRMKSRLVIVGENFHFGKGRMGNVAVLKEYSAKKGFEVISVPGIRRDGSFVNSSLIRSLIREGNISRVNELLGRPFEIEGKVIRGRSQGKHLGFPTANIQTENEIYPSGVFISLTEVEGTGYPSLTNIGTRPTYHQTEIQIETHLIDFDKTLYGKLIRISLLKKIREEAAFSSSEELALRIRQDVAKARAYYRH